MTSRLMLDTNAVSALIKGRGGAILDQLVTRPFCLSVVTEAELRYGLKRRPVSAALQNLVENFLTITEICPWTSQCAQQYAELRAALEAVGKPLAPMDLLIASQALAERCTLVTADRAFAQVPGLIVTDWTGS
jgi:tRNA(fMet)-specific endonuclease VapC